MSLPAAKDLQKVYGALQHKNPFSRRQIHVKRQNTHKAMVADVAIITCCESAAHICIMSSPPLPPATPKPPTYNFSLRADRVGSDKLKDTAYAWRVLLPCAPWRLLLLLLLRLTFMVAKMRERLRAAFSFASTCIYHLNGKSSHKPRSVWWVGRILGIINAFKQCCHSDKVVGCGVIPTFPSRPPKKPHSLPPQFASSDERITPAGVCSLGAQVLFCATLNGRLSLKYACVYYMQSSAMRAK